MMKRVALVLASALAVSCGAAKQAPMSARSAATPAEAGAPASPLSGDPHGQIEELSAKVDSERTELGLPEPQLASPVAPAAERMSIVPLSTTDASCKPAKTERCDGSCKISDSICSNASRICELASTMAGDTWAATKCARAKQTCDDAHDRCCSCQ